MALASKDHLLPIFLAVSIGTTASYVIWKGLGLRSVHKKGKKKPEKWLKVGQVEKLIIYPIKSCQGLEVDNAILTGLGLKSPTFNVRDREFLVVDPSGRPVTMGANPKMSLIHVTLNSEDEITLSGSGFNPVTFSYPSANGRNARTCQIKDDKNIQVLDCGDEVAAWFQNLLGKEGLRLCYHHLNQTQRTLEPVYQQCPQYNQSDIGTFQNATSFMMLPLQSVAELNKHFPDNHFPENKQPTYRNFRPNILISGDTEPFTEVNWSFVKIGTGESGNRVFNVAAPCHRCPITTIDQDVGVMAKDGEPLKTLVKMEISETVVDEKVRKMLNKRGVMGIRMGLYDDPNCNANREGAVIAVGDPVYVALL